MKIAIFRSELQEIGGIETWVYNLATLYGKKYDITLYYDNIHRSQLKRLAPLIKCKKYNNQEIEVDAAMYSYDLIGYESTTATKRFYVIHADHKAVYTEMLTPPDDCELVAVSKIAQKSAQEIIGRPVGLLYNPVLAVEKPIKLVSGTRLTTEKGLDRMKMLARQLDKQDVNYTWDVYTNSYEVKPFGKGVRMLKPVQDFYPVIRDCDYLVQLSDTESFGYSIVEALTLNRGLIVTDLPVLQELGIGYDNALIVGLDWKRSAYEVLARRIQNLQYRPPQSDYTEIFGEPSSVERNPTLVENLSDGDIYIPEEEQWLEPGDVYVVEDREVAERLLQLPFVKEIK